MTRRPRHSPIRFGALTLLRDDRRRGTSRVRYLVMHAAMGLLGWVVREARPRQRRGMPCRMWEFTRAGLATDSMEQWGGGCRSPEEAAMSLLAAIERCPTIDGTVPTR